MKARHKASLLTATMKFGKSKARLRRQQQLTQLLLSTGTWGINVNCFVKSFFSFLEFSSFLLFVDRFKKTFYLQKVLPSFLLIHLKTMESVSMKVWDVKLSAITEECESRVMESTINSLKNAHHWNWRQLILLSDGQRCVHLIGSY